MKALFGATVDFVGDNSLISDIGGNRYRLIVHASYTYKRVLRFDGLAALIAEFEARHWPIDPPDPIAAIRARMEQAGYTQADLARLLGSRSRASEILARRRGLTMEQARRLHEI